jgi:hypothetical protein
MLRPSGLITLLRAGAVLIATGGAVSVLAIAASPNLVSVVTPMLLFLIALGVAAAIWAIAALPSHRSAGPVDFSAEVGRALARMQTQLDTTSTRLLELHEQAERIQRTQQTMQLQPPPLTLTPADLEPMFQGLRELREITMLTDAERRDRLERYRQDRRTALVKQAYDFVAMREWSKAERLVLSMESEFPNDNEVGKARHYLEHARKLNEEEAVARGMREVEELIAGTSWDQAHARARALVEGFPHNGPVRALLDRVQREREIFQESTVARLFDELRHDIDRRMWRRAFMHAQNLLERFPTHPRSDGLRRQLKTLQDNAEIEERQELEVRIQELVKSQRFEEAIALGEDLIRRYPLSPQAESLDALLPRLRDLASRGEEDGSEPAPHIDAEISSPQRST